MNRGGEAFILSTVGILPTPGVPGVTAFNKELNAMNITLSLAPIVSLIAGILILLVPRLLNYIVAIYLIVIGLIGLFNGGHMQF